MITENQNLRCPYCGGDFDHSLNQGGIEKHTCKNCGYVFYVESEASKEKLFALNAFRNEVINLLHAKIEGGKAERIANWKKHEKTLEDYIEKCGGESNQDPLFAIARAAHITDGFERYTSKESKTIAETLYKIADDYARSNDKAINIKTLLSLYNQKLRNNTRNLVKGILFGALGALLCGVIAGLIVLNQYSPVLTDPDTGITVFIPNNAVPMFQKTGVELYVEKQPYNSGAYIDAKDALRNETEKFELYDISLISGQDSLAFDGTVTVEIPIPDGYLLSALKIYHILSDEEFEEIPATSSAAKNTISFKASHFSYYAVAERHPIVVFDTDGAGEINRQIVQRDTLAQKPVNPQKEGYNFVGWMFGDELWNFANNTVKKDMILKAKWEPVEYTITLVADGVALPTQTLKIAYKNTYASLPTNVSKAGYKFVGWYTAPENGLQITNDMVMQTAADHTLYAIFAENTNTVFFNANGGEGTMADLSLKTDNTAKLPKNTFTKMGYTFMGWSTTSDGEVEFEDNANYTMGTSATNTLYAIWKINTNTLKFDKNGGDGEMEAVQWDYGTTHTLPKNTFAKVGYTFKGWSTTPNGEDILADMAEYTMAEESEYVLFAQWEININKLYFDANGGEGLMNVVEIPYNDSINLPATVFTRLGYTFIGWSTSPTGDVEYSDRQSYTMGIVGETLYAQWQMNINKLHFNNNGGTGSMDTLEIPYKAFQHLPQNTFYREGYTFIGWSATKDGEKVYNDEDEYQMGPDSDYTLYALWRCNENAFVFHANGGTGNMPTDFAIETGGFATLPLNTFTRNGYTFIGWATTENGTVAYSDGEIYINNQPKQETIDLYAVWKVSIFTILFETNGGSKISDRSYTIEDAFTLLKPTKTGYIFAGWYEDAEFHGEAVEQIEKGSYGNKTYYAKWVVDSYSIVFNSNGGTKINSQSYNIESAISSLPTPSKTGYTFVGWYQNSDFSGKAITAIEVGTHGNIQLYAKWSLDTYYITFNVNGGEALSKIAYTIESQSFTLPTPIKTGYKFEGWYTASVSGELVERIPQGTHSNITLYAKWEALTYTVQYDANGGEGTMEPTIHTIDVSSKVAKNTFTKAKYIFVGWELQTKSGTTILLDEQSVTNIGEANQVVILKAVWERDPLADLNVVFSALTKTGTLSSSPKITYSAVVEYRNRTADSVEIRIVWKSTIGKGYYTVYGQNFNFSVGSVKSGNVQVAKFNTWKSEVSYDRSTTGTSEWVKVSLNTTSATTLNVKVYYWQTNYYNTDMYEYDGTSCVNQTWTISIPEY